MRVVGIYRYILVKHSSEDIGMYNAVVCAINSIESIVYFYKGY